ncbi:MAG: hypothetical protein WBK77_00045 [Alphaproteobacteria bacterium]
MMPLEDKIETLIEEVESAIHKVESNHIVDFTALNKDIVEACTAAQSAEPARAATLKQPIARLILKLDELAFAIKTYQNRIQGMH